MKSFFRKKLCIKTESKILIKHIKIFNHESRMLNENKTSNSTIDDIPIEVILNKNILLESRFKDSTIFDQVCENCDDCDDDVDSYNTFISSLINGIINGTLTNREISELENAIEDTYQDGWYGMIKITKDLIPLEFETITDNYGNKTHIVKSTIDTIKFFAKFNVDFMLLFEELFASDYTAL